MPESVSPYKTPPAEVDMEREEAAIRQAGTLAAVITALAFAAGYFGLGAVFAFPATLSGRIGFGLVASLFVLWWVLIGVLMVSTHRRRSAQDIGGSAAGPPSDELAIKAAFLSNTLEQAVLAVGAILAWATLTEGAWLALIPALVVLFAVGRVLFYRGYRGGASGRALGMALTMTPTIFGYGAATIVAIVQAIWQVI